MSKDFGAQFNNSTKIFGRETDIKTTCLRTGSSSRVDPAQTLGEDVQLSISHTLPLSLQKVVYV